MATVCAEHQARFDLSGCDTAVCGVCFWLEQQVMHGSMHPQKRKIAIVIEKPRVNNPGPRVDSMYETLENFAKAIHGLAN